MREASKVITIQKLLPEILFIEHFASLELNEDHDSAEVATRRFCIEHSGSLRSIYEDHENITRDKIYYCYD